MAGTYAAHDLSEAALRGPIRVSEGRFVDGYGRTLALRGLNVSGASKLPTRPNGLTHLTEGFFDHRTVTFSGRPFPLQEAPLHFRRLQAWGLPLVRLLVTWESLGHAGPNPDTDLDADYIAYLRRLVELMPRYGIKCFICAHQDVWSRFTGGSGAPGWTFEAAGLDLQAFADTGAAYVHGQDELRRARSPGNDKEPSGPFVWPSGYQKLAASTMATLFWAGDTFAPRLRCGRTPLYGSKGAPEDVSIQTFLQDAFIEAFGRLADQVGHLEACLGFDPINEPHQGLVNLHSFHCWNYNTDLHIAHFPSFAESLALGSGYAQMVDFYVKSWPFPTRISHRSLIDPHGRSVWLPYEEQTLVDRPRGMGQCIWRAHGVWDWDCDQRAPIVLQYEYFDVDHRPGREGQRIEWYRDFYAPFLQRFADRVSRKGSHRFNFVEPLPNEFIPPWSPGGAEGGHEASQQTYATKTTIETKQLPNLVYAPHFYDINVLFSKVHSLMSADVQGLARGMFPLRALYWGSRGLRKNYRKQIGNIVRHGRLSLGRHVPMLIGEVGVPFDINDQHAYRTGDYDKQRELLLGLVAAMEDNLVGFTLWNYNPDNSLRHGDGWNCEDFSLVNGDDVGDVGTRHLDYRNRLHQDDELYRGGRALDAVIQPYAVKIAGRPVRSDWDPRSLRYEFEWIGPVLADEEKDQAAALMSKTRLTEIFIPAYHYAGQRLRVAVSDGGQWSHDTAKQTLYVHHAAPGVAGPPARHRVVIEIEDLRRHLLDRVRERRRAYPPAFPRSLLPPLAVEAWLEGLDAGQIVAVAMAVVGVLVGFLGVALGYRGSP